jgi:ribosomal protein S18 acetylase RimI-like enzyme
MPWIATRPATVDDLERVRAVLVETWHATYDPIYGAAQVTAITDDWHSIANLEKQRGDGPGALMVGTWEGRIVATASATRTNAESVTLQRLYIRPAYQGLGIGDRLMRATLAHFTDCKHVSLEVEPRNTAAIDFYKARGFRRVGDAAHCGVQGSGIAAHVYARALPFRP